MTEMPMASMLVLVVQDAQALDLIALGRISCLHQVYDNLFSRKRF
jgi:hypothetical protein